MKVKANSSNQSEATLRLVKKERDKRTTQLYPAPWSSAALRAASTTWPPGMYRAHVLHPIPNWWVERKRWTPGEAKTNTPKTNSARRRKLKPIKSSQSEAQLKKIGIGTTKRPPSYIKLRGRGRATSLRKPHLLLCFQRNPWNSFWNTITCYSVYQTRNWTSIRNHTNSNPKTIKHTQTPTGTENREHQQETEKQCMKIESYSTTS